MRQAEREREREREKKQTQIPPCLSVCLSMSVFVCSAQSTRQIDEREKKNKAGIRQAAKEMRRKIHLCLIFCLSMSAAHKAGERSTVFMPAAHKARETNKERKRELKNKREK